VNLTPVCLASAMDPGSRPAAVTCPECLDWLAGEELSLWKLAHEDWTRNVFVQVHKDK
jgi:hypothetical protein